MPEILWLGKYKYQRLYPLAAMMALQSVVGSTMYRPDSGCTIQNFKQQKSLISFDLLPLRNGIFSQLSTSQHRASMQSSRNVGVIHRRRACGGRGGCHFSVWLVAALYFRPSLMHTDRGSFNMPAGSLMGFTGASRVEQR